MSLTRTAARLALYQALLTDPVVTAICGDAIYDSKIGNFSSREPVPVVILSTEGAKGEAWNPQNGGPPFNELCGITFETALRAVEFDEAGQIVGYATPITDREMEATLDALEDRLLWIVSGQDPIARAPRAEVRAVRKVVRRLVRYESERFTAEDIGEKLAIRLTTAQVELVGEEAPVSIWDTPTGSFAGLPDPLRTICAGQPEGSSGYETCRLIASKYPVPAPPSGAGTQPATVGLVIAPQPLAPGVPPIGPGQNPPETGLVVPLGG
ncbi:hypothetical protein ACQVP2_32580 [Methylobacterium aquaticum]|uniref:hypothetical protein n=1 Tax=Methylobacterium aquaticum TaxID=270351 RepID=UPI003D185E85